jgi:hypothetical protein
MHVLLLGIVICVIVYMYLVCRDVKRIEAEVMGIRSCLGDMMSTMYQQLPPASSTPVPQIPGGQIQVGQIPVAQIPVGQIPVGQIAPMSHQVLICTATAAEVDILDNVSEDLRDMLVKIEEEDEPCSMALPAIPQALLTIPDEVVAAVQVQPVNVQSPMEPTSESPRTIAESPRTMAAAESSPRTPSKVEELRLLKLDDLRKMLRERQLDVTGKKEVLITRLLAADDRPVQ